MKNRRQFLKTTGKGFLGASMMFTLPHCRPPKTVPDLSTLPRSTPEQQGVSSISLGNFLQEVEKSNIEFHSIMMLRHGHVIAEGWWDPYKPEFKHTLYSLSKSFTSTAVGMLVDDRKISVDDPVISFFPNDVPAEISENLGAMQIKHLLTMNTGHDQGTLGAMRSAEDANWPKAFLSLEVVYQPGAHFLYNSGATYMLSAVVQKVSGQTLFDFLTERLFKPLHIEGADWEADPNGVNVGGYGLRVRTEDIAKFGQLYLQKGQWGDQQLISEEWIDAATQKQSDSQDGDNDWSQGYGYQFWRCKPAPGFYRGDGAFGQYCIVIPQYDTVFAITSESFDMQASMKLIWDYILPNIQNDTLEDDETSASSLKNDLANLSLIIPRNSLSSPIANQISGQEFHVEENQWEVSSVRFNFEVDTCTFSFTSKDKVQQITCGMNDWNTEGNVVQSLSDLFPQNNRNGVSSQIAATATWQDEKTLLMTWRFVENAHHDQLTCVFEDNQVTISFLNSIVAGRGEPDQRPTLTASKTT